MRILEKETIVLIALQYTLQPINLLSYCLLIVFATK